VTSKIDNGIFLTSEPPEGLGGEGFFPRMHLLKRVREYLTLCTEGKAKLI